MNSNASFGEILLRTRRKLRYLFRDSLEVTFSIYEHIKYTVCKVSIVKQVEFEKPTLF